MQYGQDHTRIRRLTGPGSEGHYYPGHQGHELRRSDVGPNRPASLAPKQEMIYVFRDGKVARARIYEDTAFWQAFQRGDPG